MATWKAQKKKYFMIVRNNRNLVVCKIENSKREAELIPAPNFDDTGMALCGVLQKNQTFDNFLLKYKRSEI